MPGRNSDYKLAIRIAGEIDKTFPKSIQHSKAELRAIAREASVASREISKSSFMDTSRLNETKGAFTAIEKAGVKAFKAVAKASVTAGAAIGAFSVKTGMDYEKQMSTVKAISKASEGDSKKLQEEAKRIGATTASTAKEAGQAMEYEAMAGWKTDQIIEATSAIVDLKQSSDDLDLATTSDILTDGITAFGMKAKDATHMADVLAASSTSANTDVAKMGESFKYAAPMAGSMGYSVEDTALNLGLMANAGIKSSMAGTTERNWIKRMVKPTKESKAAMKDLNLSTKDEKGKSKSLLEITEDVRKAFSKIKDKDDRTKYAAMLAGSQGMSGLLAITKTSEKDFQKLKAAIYDCDGAAKDLANTKLDNLAGDVTLLSSATQGAGIDIYEEIKEPLRELVQGATEWVGDFAKGFKTSFPTIVREAKQAGEAIAEFAEPFLELGGWMLENPDVIAGTITGIGTAVGAHKVIQGVDTLKTALGGLTKASLPLLGFTAAVGIIAGIGTAVITAGKQAREASLDDHFGDIALSMDEVKCAAKELVGSKQLEEVDKLFGSMEQVEKFADNMERAREDLGVIQWKLSGGLELSDSDLSTYESGVKDFVSNAQEKVAAEGYEVNVATKVLFGDSKEGKDLIKDNNAFFKSLNEKAGDLAKKINEKLEKAMKDGLSVDLDQEINGMLDQLSEATAKVSEAEAKTSWQMLEGKWSGKDLDADSFKNLIEEVKANRDKLNKGAEDSKWIMLEALNKKEDSISKAEYEKEYKLINQTYQDRLDKSDASVSDFIYKTIMDTYGKELKDGTLEGDDWNGLMDILDTVKGTVPLKGDLGTLMRSLDSIDQRTTRGSIDSVDDLVKRGTVLPFFSSYKDIVVKTEQKEGFDVLADAEKNVDELTKAYFNENLEVPAEEAGKNAASGAVDSMTKGIKSDMSKGIDVKTDIRLQGTYSLTDAEKKEVEVTSKKAGKKKKQGKVVLNKIKTISPTPYASGGIATEPVIYVAEAGKSESIIPLDGSQRSMDLWRRTGDLLGAADHAQPEVKPFSELLSRLTMAMSPAAVQGVPAAVTEGPVHIVYSPNFTIQGNADEKVISAAAKNGFAEFRKMMERYEKEKRRRSLKGGGR